MKNFYFIILLLYCECSSAQYSNRPNILFIIVDDLNDYTGYMQGHPQTFTPNLDALTQESIVFTNAFCSSPVCAPSRTSLLSGKDAFYTQVYNNEEYLSPFRANFSASKNNAEVITLPEYLKDQGGYYTYGAGKIFQNPGDDYDVLAENPCNRKLSWNTMKTIADAQAVETYEDENNEGFSSLPWGILPDALEEEMQDAKVTDSVIQFLSDFASGKDFTCGKPFFLAVGISKPHADHFVPDGYFLPYYVHDYFAQPYYLPYNFPADTFPYNGVIMPAQPETAWSDFYALPEHGVARNLVRNTYNKFIDFPFTLDELPVIDSTLTEEERIYILQESKRANMVMAYLACVQFADAQIGKVLDALRSYPDLNKNTIIVLTSDNGFSLGEKNHWEKGGLWETDTRVPLLFRTPCYEPATVDFTTSLLDIFPTLCDLAGVQHPAFSNGEKYLDGMSLTPLFENTDAFENTRAVVSAIKPNSGAGSCFPQYSVRNTDYHLLTYAAGDIAEDPDCVPDTEYDEKELYHLGTYREFDANEWVNIAYDTAYTEKISELKSYLPGEINYLNYSVYSSGETTACFVNNYFQTQVITFPNPAQDILYIQSENNVTNTLLRVFDSKGALSFQFFYPESLTSFEINIHALPQGLYFLEMNSDNSKFSSKFTKL